MTIFGDFVKDTSVIQHSETPDISFDIIRDVNTEKYGFFLCCKNNTPSIMCRFGFSSTLDAWIEAMNWLEDHQGIDDSLFPLRCHLGKSTRRDL
ncbi:hypothetical protein AXE65_00570 [Ventosimonas gracilis]|uniref:Uncharacterized protein n=2 Tax=Ventosimonas gracilis TaxID=1680762 RepID=A0A139SRE8_9GAMM|nr:hypothetical protein AXE65_00570 [Ventosimonas gracilis]